MANWTASYGRYITLKVTATELNVNTANNTSQVRVQTSLYYGGGTRAVNGYPQTLTVSVNGSNIGTQTGITYNLASGATMNLNTYTSGNIAHNADGSKSVNVTVSITDNAGDNGKISQTLTLTKIARASTPTLSASSVAIGSAVTINTNRASSSFTHTATFKFGSITKTITTKNTNASFTYTPTNDLATQVPNSSSGSGTITLTTYSGATAIGSKTIGLTVTVPSNATFNPTISAPTVSEGVADVTNKVGAVYVQGKSKFVVKATPTTRGGATVKSVVFTVKGSTHTGSGSGSGTQYSATTGTLSDTGSHAISVTVTDSRGRTATASIGTAPTVLAYAPPKITAFSASRRAGETTTVDIARTVTYSIVGSNTVNVKIDRQQVGSSTVTNVQNVNLTTGSSNNTAPPASTGNSDASSYRFMLTVSDKFSSASSSITVTTAGATMSWGKDGIAAGGIYNNALGGALQISGDVYANNRKIINRDGNIEVHDTRSVIPTTDIGDKGVMFEFKSNGIDGLNDGGLYHAVMTLQQWGDSSGGLIHQLGFGYNSMWFRNATVGNVWSAWGEIPSADYGSNANGHYLKYGNGVLICFKSMHSVTAPMNLASGSLFRSGNLEWIFPHGFTSYSAVSVFGTTRVWSKWLTTNGNDYDRARFVQWGTSSSNTTEAMSVMAIGRWK